MTCKREELLEYEPSAVTLKVLTTYAEEPDCNHGRIDCREIAVYPIEPVEAGLPGARTLAVVRRLNAAADDPEPELAYYHSSESLEDRPGAQLLRRTCTRTLGRL